MKRQIRIHRHDPDLSEVTRFLSDGIDPDQGWKSIAEELMHAIYNHNDRDARMSSMVSAMGTILGGGE